MNGKNAPDAEVRMIASDGLYLTVEGVGYFAAFRDFPFLVELPLSQIFQVEYCGHGHIRWEEADIDLHTDILAHPECFPVDMQSGGGISAAAAPSPVGSTISAESFSFHASNAPAIAASW